VIRALQGRRRLGRIGVAATSDTVTAFASRAGMVLHCGK
jgi:hypothetical protein